MKILIDANVALDVLLERQPFHVSGSQILGLSKGGIGLFISASTITDIYYIFSLTVTCWHLNWHKKWHNSTPFDRL